MLLLINNPNRSNYRRWKYSHDRRCVQQHERRRRRVCRRLRSPADVDHRSRPRTERHRADGSSPQSRRADRESLPGRKHTISPEESDHLEQQPAEHARDD